MLIYQSLFALLAVAIPFAQRIQVIHTVVYDVQITTYSIRGTRIIDKILNYFDSASIDGYNFDSTKYTNVIKHLHTFINFYVL